MLNHLSELNMIQKSVRLTSLLQSLNSFTSCISDLSWLFQQSLHIIQQFIRESFDYYKQRKSKRIRLDNIQKQYLTLKLRFQAVDLSQIQMFIQQLGKQQTHRRKSSTNSLSDLSSHRQNPPSNTYRDQSSRSRTDRVDLMQITERQTLNRRQHQLNQKVNENNENMKHLNYQINKLKQQNMVFREQIIEIKKVNNILVDSLHNKRMNQLNAIDKIKSAIRIIKDQNGTHYPHLDRVLFNLVEFESRLKDNANAIITGQFYEPIQCIQTKRNNLMLQINTIMRQVDDLKQEKNFVEEQIEQLAHIYQQRKIEGKTLATNSSIGCTCNVSENNDQMFLLVQALTIERLLN